MEPPWLRTLLKPENMYIKFSVMEKPNPAANPYITCAVIDLGLTLKTTVEETGDP